MNADALFALLTQAKALCGHTDDVVIGSPSVLGMSEVATIPADMTLPIVADCYTKADPGRAIDLQPALGAGRCQGQHPVIAYGGAAHAEHLFSG